MCECIHSLNRSANKYHHLKPNIMSTLKTISKTESKGYRAIASVRRIASRLVFANLNNHFSPSPADFRGADWTQAHHIRGGNP